MKIGGITTNNVINSYSDKKKIVNGKSHAVSGDSLEISNIGKSLSSYSIDELGVNSKEKLANIKSAISNGTYNSDASLTAKKMMDIVKNVGV